MSAPGPVAGISAREFARREPCDEKLVRRALLSGALKLRDDGLLDPAFVGSGWRRANRRKAGGADSPRKVRSSVSAVVRKSAAATQAPATKPEAAPRTAAAPHDLAEAERLRANYLAQLRQLEFEERSGELLSKADVVRQIGACVAIMRTRLLAIPAEQTLRLHQLKTAAEVHECLTSLITGAMEETCEALRKRGLGDAVQADAPG